MMTRAQAEALIGKILTYSKVPDCSVEIDETEQASIRFANNGVTTAGFTVERSISVSSTKEKKTGVSRTSEIGDNALKAAVARSEELAAISPANPEMTDPLGPQKYPEVPGWDEDTAAARGPVMIPHVRAIIDNAAKNKLVAAGFFIRAASVAVTANKRGLFGYDRSTVARLSTTVRAPDGSSSGWAGQPSPRIREINGAMLGEIAAGKCLQWRNPKRIEPGKFTVLLEPTAVSDLVRLMGQSFSARNAEEGRSFLSRKGGGTLAGEKLFPETVTLVTDPFDSRNYGSPWSPSGIPNRRTAWIEKGAVANLAYDRYWASKAGKEPTPSPGSLVMEGGNASQQDLIGGVKRGLLVTRFWYIRAVNPQTLQFTGLTRDGLFLIEDGRIAAPVMNLRFNESPVRMLQNVERFGKPAVCQGGEGQGMVAPAIVARDFTFTSLSDAV